MKRVFKYQLDLREESVVKMPGPDPLVLSAGLDPSGEVCVWAAVDGDPNTPKVTVRVWVVGTGNEPPAEGRFVGTVRQQRFIWHIFVAGA